MKLNILHTEASKGLGGQELRILKESEGMRRRGHEVILAVVEGGQLVGRARDAGFQVYEIPLENKRDALSAAWALSRIINKHQIAIVNTHSSWDAWVGGITARLIGRKVVRTRHLSTPTRKGLNSRVLYKSLADAVVTTCEETARSIQTEVNLPSSHCRSIPTGVQPEELAVSAAEVQAFRQQYHIQPDEIVIGTACVLRFWKGITDLIDAAKLLEANRKLKWLIVGDGPSRHVFEQQARTLKIHDHFIFTGYLRHPQVAIASMDLFLLLSTANEGVSQASLQAAYLQRPLITTHVGGLGEVCLEGSTGFLVPTHSPCTVAERVSRLAANPQLRETLGAQGRKHVLDRFTIDHTLDAMEQVYRAL